MNAFGWIAEIAREYAVDLGRTGGLILLLVVARIAIARAIAANPRVPIDARRRWSINARNALVLVGVLGVAGIWAKEIETFAVSVVAFAAALVLATKELIMCLGGAFLRTMSNAFSVGDHIEIGGHRGRVVDINLFSTTIMEIGPRHDAHFITGRAVSLPNSLLLTAPVIRENFMGDIVVHVITVPLSYEHNPNRMEAMLLAIANEVCAPHLAAAERHMLHIEARHLVDTPSVQPRIAFLPVDDKRYQLMLRVAIPANERNRVEQAILHRLMQQAFPDCDAALPARATAEVKPS
ncbi:mechanosensitive ion channel-like protein [Crenobacter luteus]|uniref:Mechanosensitive ion channel protein MscS n=1 Tax=Crenobacter luteus TaxID=1452487 RepID=A0A163DNS1_9NEIS|nr:mechanosensitive ion channel domain-containing protein [Crenobacter luteus]KZE35076.1 mechanosensitive ion channel protein MscS [Crenobacter luteus]TCP11246.1 mechanosensitive ion channel-like protein [Crenobacter luteus]